MTNGEKLQSVFPDTKIITQFDNTFGDRFIVFRLNNENMEVNIDWWNAKYEEPTTKNDLDVDYIDRNSIKYYPGQGGYMYASKGEIDKLPSVIPSSSVLAKNSKELEKDFGESDCISRQAVLELIADYDLSMGQVVRGIHALPPVTPQEPRKGHWVYCKCDKCGYVVQPWNTTSFCPHCGADMREVEK